MSSDVRREITTHDLRAAVNTVVSAIFAASGTVALAMGASRLLVIPAALLIFLTYLAWRGIGR